MRYLILVASACAVSACASAPRAPDPVPEPPPPAVESAPSVEARETATAPPDAPPAPTPSPEAYSELDVFGTGYDSGISEGRAIGMRLMFEAVERHVLQRCARTGCPAGVVPDFDHMLMLIPAPRAR